MKPALSRGCQYCHELVGFLAMPYRKPRAPNVVETKQCRVVRAVGDILVFQLERA